MEGGGENVTEPEERTSQFTETENSRALPVPGLARVPLFQGQRHILFFCFFSAGV